MTTTQTTASRPERAVSDGPIPQGVDPTWIHSLYRHADRIADRYHWHTPAHVHTQYGAIKSVLWDLHDAGIALSEPPTSVLLRQACARFSERWRANAASVQNREPWKGIGFEDMPPHWEPSTPFAPPPCDHARDEPLFHAMACRLETRGEISRSRAWTFLLRRVLEMPWDEVCAHLAEMFPHEPPPRSTALRQWAKSHFGRLEEVLREEGQSLLDDVRHIISRFVGRVFCEA